jgi:aldehyde reductase
VRKAIETTLRNLKLDYLDLYLIHWPMSYKEDGEKLFPKDAAGLFIDGGIDYMDTWKAMEELVDAGLTKSVGVSNFNKRQIDRVVANGKSPVDLFMSLTLINSGDKWKR